MSTMSINKLTLQQAMETLKTMFPSISPEVLKTNLYRTNGRMEDTIEILLQMQTSPRDPQLDEPRMDLVARREDDFVPHSLPPDFLCYDFDDVKLSSSSQTANDEQLAVRLQRQMILEGMEEAPAPALRASQHQRNNMIPPQQQHSPARSQIPAAHQPVASGGIASRNAPQQQSSALDSVAEKLSGLSAMAKKKFADFYQRFGGNTSASQEQSGANASRKPLSGNGPEYSSLLNAKDDDEDEQTPSSFYDNKKL